MTDATESFCSHSTCPAEATWTDWDGRRWCGEHGHSIAVLSPDIVKGHDEGARSLRAALRLALQRGGVAHLRPAPPGSLDAPHTEHDRGFLFRWAYGELYELHAPGRRAGIAERWRTARTAAPAGSGRAFDAWSAALRHAVNNNDRVVSSDEPPLPCTRCGAPSVAAYVFALAMESGEQFCLSWCTACERTDASSTAEMIQLGICRRFAIIEGGRSLGPVPAEVAAAIDVTPPPGGPRWLLYDERESAASRSDLDEATRAYDRAVAIAVQVGASALTVDGPPLQCYGGHDACQNSATVIYISSSDEGGNAFTAQCANCDRQFRTYWVRRMRRGNSVRIAIRPHRPTGHGSSAESAPKRHFVRRIRRLLGRD